MQAILQKLPNNLQMKWHENGIENRQKDGKIVGYRDLTKYQNVKYQNIKTKPGQQVVYSWIRAKIKEQKLCHESGGFYPVPLFTLGRVFLPKHSCILPFLHDLEKCVAFERKSVGERQLFVAKRTLCFTCYGNSHVLKNCRKEEFCDKCKKPHPTLLHIDLINSI